MIHKELNHVNVVQMHHYFEDNLNVYMLLEACPRKVSYVSSRLTLPVYYFSRSAIFTEFRNVAAFETFARNVFTRVGTRRYIQYVYTVEFGIQLSQLMKYWCESADSYRQFWIADKQGSYFTSHRAFPTSLFTHHSRKTCFYSPVTPARLKSTCRNHSARRARETITDPLYLSAERPGSERPCIFIPPERERHLHSSRLICRPVCTVRRRCDEASD